MASLADNEFRLAVAGENPRFGRVLAAIVFGPGTVLAIWGVATLLLDDVSLLNKAAALVCLACALVYIGAFSWYAFVAPRTYGGVRIEADNLRIVQPILFAQPLVIPRTLVTKVAIDANRDRSSNGATVRAAATRVSDHRQLLPKLTSGTLNGAIVLSGTVSPSSQTLWARIFVPLDRFSALYFRAVDPDAAADVMRREGLLARLTRDDDGALAADRVARRRLMIRSGLTVLPFLASWLLLAVIIGDARGS